MKKKLEEQFTDEMFAIYKSANQQLGYNATRYFQMLANDGAITTANTLVLQKGYSLGMTFLWENKRLDLSVEVLVINPKYKPLFKVEVVEIARKKLLQLGYSIE